MSEMNGEETRERDGDREGWIEQERRRWAQANRQEVSHTQTQTTGELDRRMLEILDGQLAGLAKAVNKQTTILLLIGVLCFGALAWMQHTQNLFQERIRQQLALMETTQKALREEMLEATRKMTHDAGLASKHVWELKRALQLKFSQERSAEKRAGMAGANGANGANGAEDGAE